MGVTGEVDSDNADRQTDRQTNKQTNTIQAAQTAGPLLLGFDACVHSFHWIQRLQSADFPAL